MSTETRARKRKLGDDVVPAAKKAKTAKSAEKPAPLKSALKKSKVETTVVEKPKEKKTKKVKKFKPVVEEEDFQGVSDNDSQGRAELTADQTAALLAGFSSSEDEASDAEDDNDGVEVSKLPSAPTSKEVKKQLAQAKKNEDPESTPGVIYVGRIPHGFHETQMTAYFSQFGEITRLRLARNKSTGKSKHYAFVEFESAAVADIVARTMDKYLLFGHILQVRTVPAEQVKDVMFKIPTAMKKGGKVRPRNKIEGTKLRKGLEREGWERRVKKETKRREGKAEKLKEMGYEFEMPGVKSVEGVPVNGKGIEGGDAEPGAEEGVKLIEGKKSEVAPGVEEEVEKIVKADGKKVTKEVRSKRKSKEGSTTTVTKKTKVAE
ncbi:hypothetical protein M409DRAFT_22945 [Zasmidium cellare ATCC 36951]|uniref:RRM domain-containing protein n=1 Tax=Zasmidium cellare ATCC 36951 TaxID=1080233 RepID=A0A6A6CJU7_ZASCE|nr:uncharacterized protein M409DRAFT_22945 [Zasmidium cellare ATCC 36951]KAF2166893.1 hypothetical protein M409DRAFT_22945 [Zasmidium cellare ATCC 36951]